MGLRYRASMQDVDETRQRVEAGECWVATHANRLVGTILFRAPDITGHEGGCAHYERADVASFHQFGVEPAWQGRGVGRRLLEIAADRALECGATELACDTAEPARHLIEHYERWGFRRVESVDWRPHVNYRSVILSRTLTPHRSETR